MIRKLLTDGCSCVLCKTCEFFKYSSIKGNSGMRLCEIEYVRAGIKALLPKKKHLTDEHNSIDKRINFVSMGFNDCLDEIDRLFGKEKP